MFSADEPLGVLLVGYDGAGIQNHQLDMYEPALVDHPEFTVVAISDDARAGESRVARSREAALRLDVPYVEVLEDALGIPSVDVASVCVSFDRRVAVVEQVAARGIHVLVDKPMALTLEEVDRIADVAEDTGIICFPAHHHRFKDSIRQAASAIAEGQLGEIRAIHSDFLVARGATRATAGDPSVWPLGELMNFTVYPIDTIRSMCGLEIRRVHATRGGFFYGGLDDEDFGVLSLTLDDGVIATVSVGRAPHTGHLSGVEHRYRIVGSQGMLLVDAQDSIGVIHARDRARALPAAGMTNSVTALLDELAGAVRGHSTADFGPLDARAALAVTLAARRSADISHVVEL